MQICIETELKESDPAIIYKDLREQSPNLADINKFDWGFHANEHIASGRRFMME